MTDDYRSHYSVRFSREMLAELGCDHNDPSTLEMTAIWCRPCSVSLDMHLAREAGDITIMARDDVAEGARWLFGTCETAAARRALCRLQALAMGHPEPLDPEDATTARERIESYG